MAKGISSSTIIHTKTEAGKRYDKAKVERRKKRASQCIGCGSNAEGYCNDLKNWCFNAQPSCSKCVQTVPDYKAYIKPIYKGKMQGKTSKRKKVKPSTTRLSNVQTKPN